MVKRNIAYEAGRRKRKMWPRDGRVQGNGGNRAYGGTRSNYTSVPPPSGPVHLPLPRLGPETRQEMTPAWLDWVVGISSLASTAIACIWPERVWFVAIGFVGLLYYVFTAPAPVE